MWNGQQQYVRSRSHSFSGHNSMAQNYVPTQSPGAFPAVHTNLETMQPSRSPVPVSPGGFVIPQHGYEPQLPPADWDIRGRSTERAIDTSRGHEHRHHTDTSRQRRHRNSHSHSHEPAHAQLAPQGHHHHEHKHRHDRHSHKRPSSHSPMPNINVHANGQTYYIPSRPVHQYHQTAPVPGPTMISTHHLRPSHSATHLAHANGAVMTTHAPQMQMQMPMPHLPPKDMQYYGPQIANKRHYFKYSQCTRRKKALCIGINYLGQSKPLNGCINDAKRMRSFLIKHYGFKAGDIVLLTDEGRSQRERPTKRNIYDAMKWLVRDAQPDDSLVFHFSGHGGQTPDLDGDEVDGFDEVIYSLDYERTGHILDDDMHTIMVKPLPVGCRLTAIFDCCHSGSALDLPYTYGTGGKLKREPNLERAAGDDTFGADTFRDVSGVDDLTQAFGGMMSRGPGPGTQRRRRNYAVKIKTSPADVISWSGCKDSQTSADTFKDNEATGAMSYAFMSSLKAKPHQTYQELLVNIRRILKKQFSQKPQLSSSHPIDTSLKFVL